MEIEPGKNPSKGKEQEGINSSDKNIKPSFREIVAGSS